MRKNLLRLTKKRLERFVGMLPKFLVNDDPKLVHDLRVRSRRLQQALRVVLPRPGDRQGKKIIKVLRDVRRSLGECRNLDVILALAHERARSPEQPATSAAWSVFIQSLSADRPSMVDQARRRIRKHDLPSFIAHTQDLLESIDPADHSLADLRRSLSKSLARWDQAYAMADRKRDTEELHSLRIAGKRLRYRAELLAAVNIDRLKPMAEDLKTIQDALGAWHDRWVMTQCMAEFVRRPNFVEERATVAAALLAAMEQERRHRSALIDRFFTDTPVLRKRWRAEPHRAQRKKRDRNPSSGNN